MAEYDGFSEYRKVAKRRMRDAEELLQPPSLAAAEQGAETRHLRAAVYLAGHAVECILKAYLIDRQPPAQTLSEAVTIRRAAGEVVPNILGDEGHRLPLLLVLTQLEPFLIANEDRRRDWGVCSKWKSTWRYDPISPSREFAAEFVAASGRFCEWVQQQL